MNRRFASASNRYKVPCVLAFGVVGYEIRLVFKRNAWLGRLLRHWNMILLPSFTAIAGAPHKDSVAGSTVRPVVERAQLIERNVADEGMTVIIEDSGNIAGNSVVFRIDSLSHGPGFPCIVRIGSMSVVLKHGEDLLWICEIHGNSGLGKKSGLRGERKNLSLRSFGQIVRIRKNARTDAENHSEELD